MAARFPPGPRMTYLLGDVRDPGRLGLAFDGVTAVIHGAALKHIHIGEEQADEFYKTNCQGSANVTRAALDAGVSRCLLVSTDKAIYPINLYGKTKAVAESLFVQANAAGLHRGSRFAVARGGNVWGSRGSVSIRWRMQRLEGKPLTVTDPDMTRFHLPMDDWTAFCWQALCQMHGGEIFVPKLRAWRLGDLADAFAVNGWHTNGTRPGEKQSETLLAADEAG